MWQVRKQVSPVGTDFGQPGVFAVATLEMTDQCDGEHFGISEGWGGPGRGGMVTVPALITSSMSTYA
jgi:hypothetical protein